MPTLSDLIAGQNRLQTFGCNVVWDVNLLDWVAMTQPGGGGGGGGPATIADGADVAEGATTDIAVVSDANGTVSGKLRGLVKIFASVWDSGNGRLKVDGSAVTQPVSIATMPSTPVTGAFYPATQPISGAVSFTAPQHVVVDSGSITTPAVMNDGTFAKETGGNLAAILTELGSILTQLEATLTVTVTGSVTTPPVTNDGTFAAPMAQAQVNDAPQSYTIGSTEPLSLTADGRLRVASKPSDVDHIWQHTFDNPYDDYAMPAVDESAIAFAGAI